MFGSTTVRFLLTAALICTACGGGSKSKSATAPTLPPESGAYTSQPAPPPAPSAAETQPGMTPSERQPVSGTTSGEPSPTPAPGSAIETSLKPGSALAILVAGDQAEIDAANLAIETSKNKDVKQFAKQIVADHTAMMDKSNALAKSENVTLETGGEIDTMKKDAQTSLDNLRGLSGADFDRAFVDKMVQDHDKALMLIDERILPAAASDPQLNDLVTGARPKISAHRDMARQLQGKLGMSKG